MNNNNNNNKGSRMDTTTQNTWPAYSTRCPLVLGVFCLLCALAGWYGSVALCIAS